MAHDLTTLMLDCLTRKCSFDVWEQALADDFTGSYPNARRGMIGKHSRGYNEAYLPLMSDASYEVTGTAVSGDTTYTRYVLSGTHDGPLFLEQFKSRQPSGKKITLPGVLVVQQREGKIVREEMYWNQMELLDQIGFL